MKIPIPNDWDGETWQCIQVQWPDSDLWRALLIGFLTSSMRGRFWDERTGEIKNVQATGREIYDANFPFTSCEGDIPDQPDNGNGSDVGELVGAICASMEDFYMSNCSVPFGSLRWANGRLQFRYCGEWYDVEGAQGDYNDEENPGVTEPFPQPGDDDAPDVPPSLDDATACSKAVAVMDVIHTAVDVMFDETNEGTIVPSTIINAIQDAIPGINWGHSSLLKAILAAMAINIAGEDSQSNDATFRQRLLCAVAAVISDGNQGLDADERKAVQNALAGSVSSQKSVLTNPLTFGQWWNLYVFTYRAIGANDTLNLTSYALPSGDENCDCPYITGTYTGDLWFTGEATIEQENGTVYVDRVEDNGRVLIVGWAKPADNMMQNDKNLYFKVQDNTGGIESITLKVTAVAGYKVPADAQGVMSETITVSQWTRHNPWGWSSTYVDGDDNYTISPTDPIDPPGSLSQIGWRAFRSYHWTDNTDAETYKVRFEIIEINGVDYGS